MKIRYSENSHYIDEKSSREEILAAILEIEMNKHRLQRKIVVDGDKIGWMVPGCTCGWQGEKVSREEGFKLVVEQEQKHLEEVEDEHANP